MRKKYIRERGKKSKTESDSMSEAKKENKGKKRAEEKTTWSL